MKLTNKIRSLSKKAKLAVAIVALGVVIGAPIAARANFFPNRPTFDYNKGSDASNCSDPADPGYDLGRCGSHTGPVFNSFINTPEYGDERQFTDGRRSDMPTNTNKDTVADVTEGSKKVVIRMYVHNNANQSTNASGLGIARNTKVAVELPTNSGSALQAVGAISATNATPTEVTDTVFLTANRKFHVAYEAGSAKLLRGAASYPLSDSIVSGGAPIGNTAMDGNLPGCFEYAALVEITVNIIPDENVNLQLVKEVKVKGATDGWKKEVAVKPGTEVQFRLGTKNIGLDQLTNVDVRDVLPPHVALVPGSVRLIDANQDTVQNDPPLFGGGLGLGTYPSGGIRYIIFNTTTKSDFEGCSIRLRNQAFAKSDQTPTEVKDTSDVVITKENCNPPPTYSCDLLTVVKGANRLTTYTVNASAAGGATIKNYTFSFGDGTPDFTSTSNTTTHTYAKDGQYAARATVLVQVGNEVKTATSDKCATAVDYTTPGTPGAPGTPGGATPTSLPDTGAGSTAAIFVAVTAAGSIGYSVVARRRI